MRKITDPTTDATLLQGPSRDIGEPAAAPFFHLLGDPQPSAPTLEELDGAAQIRPYRAKGIVVAELAQLSDGRVVLLRRGVDPEFHLLRRLRLAVCFQRVHLEDAAAAGAHWAVVVLTTGPVLAGHLDAYQWLQNVHPTYGDQLGLPLDAWQALGSVSARRAA